MLRLLRNLVIVVALALGIAFAYYNFQPITVNMLFGKVRLPLVAILIVSFIVGFLVAGLLLGARIFLLRRALGRSRRPH